MNNIKNSLQIACVFTGTVLGAGFASGQEMMKFFAYYGYKGMLGLLLTGVMFAIIGWAILEIIYIRNCKNFTEFIEPITGKFFGNVLEWVVIFFMFVCLCAMFAGSGALFEQRFGLPYQIGVLAMAISCYVTFLNGVKGVIAVNSIIAPMLLVGVVILGLYMWIFRSSAVLNNVVEVFMIITDNWLSSAIIYISYNIITAVVVLIALNKLVTSKLTAKLGSLLAGVALGMIGIILGFVILIYYTDIQGLEIPLLAVVMKYAPMIQYIYIIVLLSAMFTTAVANGYGILTKFKIETNTKKNRIKLMFFILIAITFSQIGFSNMVGKVYPIFGYIGIFEIISIFIYFIKIKLSEKSPKMLYNRKSNLAYKKSCSKKI